MTTAVSETIALLLDSKEKIAVKASEYVFTSTDGEPERMRCLEEVRAGLWCQALGSNGLHKPP